MSTLRPIERRILKLATEGADDLEIAWRFRRTPKNVRQVLACAQLPREVAGGGRADPLRPIERRLLRWREEGAGFEELATRFRRGTSFLEQVERLAQVKLAR